MVEEVDEEEEKEEEEKEDVEREEEEDATTSKFSYLCSCTKETYFLTKRH